MPQKKEDNSPLSQTPQGPEKALAQLCLNPNRFSCFLQGLHGFVVQILGPAHLHCNTAPERTRGLSQQEAELQNLPQKRPTDSSPIWLQYAHPPSSRSSKLQCLLPWKQVPALASCHLLGSSWTASKAVSSPFQVTSFALSSPYG